MDIFDAVLAAQIAKNGPGGGSVTSVNGKTGTVVLTASDVGAEPEKFVVTVTGGRFGISADKTFTEINEAISAGKTVVARKNNAEYHLVFATDSAVAFFNNMDGPLEGLVWQQLKCAFDGTNDTWTNSSGQVVFVKTITRKDSTVSITPAANTVYTYTAAALTSLTITDPPATGAYSIVFTSGSTATTSTIPATILGLEDFAPEANTMYEINVLDNRAVVGSWAVTP